MILSNCGVGEDSWESLGQHGDHTSQSWRKSTLNIPWKDWCWSWSSNILATWCEELTHWKRAWCWERVKAGGEGGNRGWDGWMVSLTQWTWVFEQTQEDGDRERSLVCCSPWGCKVRHYLVTEQQLQWLTKTVANDVVHLFMCLPPAYTLRWNVFSCLFPIFQLDFCCSCCFALTFAIAFWEFFMHSRY